jgi:hypothetical protein
MIIDDIKPGQFYISKNIDTKRTVFGLMLKNTKNRDNGVSCTMLEAISWDKDFITFNVYTRVGNTKNTDNYELIDKYIFLKMLFTYLFNDHKLNDYWDNPYNWELLSHVFK